MSGTGEHQPPPCELLSWDSAFFGTTVGRVLSTRLDASLAAAVDDWSRSQGVALLYLEADPEDPTTVRTAERHGYGLVDVRVVLDRPLTGAAPETPRTVRTEPVLESDLPALIPMARAGFRDSRFYFDPNIPDAQCDTLYERWIEESVRGFADRVIVARVDGSAAGFVTCHLDEGKSGRIGLIAVGERSRGRGVGEALVASALEWFAGEGAETAIVATQARNVRAQRLYAKAGFRVSRVSLYYHKWFMGSST